MIRRLGYLLVLVVLLLLTSPAQPAQAAFGIDCKEAPAAEAPDTGIAGFFTDRNKSEPPGPAWQNGGPVYSHYGQAGYTFHTYDLGCGPDAARNPDAVFGTALANWLMIGPRAAVALTTATLHAAYTPTYLQVFDPLLRQASDTLRTTLFVKWLPLSLTVIGIILLATAHRGATSTAFLTAAWAVLVMVIAAVLFQYPVKAGSVADGSVGDVLGAVNKGMNGQSGDNPVDATAGAMTSATLYQEWKLGTFGRTHSKTIDRYAKAIYTGQALTYSEARTVQDDPSGKGKALLDAKARQWEAAAAKIKDGDPDAYEYLTGKRSAVSVAAALIAWYATLCLVPFLLVSSLLMIGAYLIIRLAVVFFPVIAVVGVAYSARSAVIGIGSVVAAAIINSIGFGVGVALTMLATRLLLTAALPTWLALTLMGLFTFIMWFAMRPMMRLTRMARPSFRDAAGALGDAGRGAAGAAVGFAKTAAAAYVGADLAIDQHTEEGARGRDGAPGAPAAPRNRTEGYTQADTRAPSSPAPQPVPAAPERAAVTGVDTPAPTALPAPHPEETAPTPLPTPTAAPVALPAAPAAATHPAPAAPTVAAVDTSPVDHTLPGGPAAAPAIDAAPTRVADDVSEAPFVPGVAVPDLEPVEAPMAAEVEIDPDTGDEVYSIFRPDEAPVGSRDDEP